MNLLVHPQMSQKLLFKNFDVFQIRLDVQPPHLCKLRICTFSLILKLASSSANVAVLN